jgi:hypothetical protein
MSEVFKIVAAMLAHIRGDLTAEAIAETYGVTEAQVEQWKDIMIVAGVVALTDSLTNAGDELTFDVSDEEPTTLGFDEEPTTKPPVRRGGKGTR